MLFHFRNVLSEQTKWSQNNTRTTHAEESESILHFFFTQYMYMIHECNYDMGEWCKNIQVCMKNTLLSCIYLVNVKYRINWKGCFTRFQLYVMC